MFSYLQVMFTSMFNCNDIIESLIIHYFYHGKADNLYDCVVAFQPPIYSKCRRNAINKFFFMFFKYFWPNFKRWVCSVLIGFEIGRSWVQIPGFLVPFFENYKCCTIKISILMHTIRLTNGCLGLCKGKVFKYKCYFGIYSSV